MNIFINNEQKDFSSAITLEQLLKELKLFEQKGFAVAVNEEVFPKSAWSTYQLKENDKVLIIQATQGG